MLDSRTERIGFLAAVVAAILFGAAYPITAIALRSFQPLALAALQGTIALVVILLLVAAGLLPGPRSWAFRRRMIGRLTALGLLGGVAFAASMNVAVSLAGSTITSFVATLYAVLATVFAIPLLGERIRPTTILALAVALLGTVLLAGFDPLGTSLLGTIVALGAAVAFALYLVLSRRWGAGHDLDGTLIAIAVLLGRGPVLLIVELVREPQRIVPSAPDPVALIALALLVIGPSTTAQFAVLASVKRVPARRTSAALLLTPLASAALAAIVLGERLAPVEIIGAALVLAGIAGAGGGLELLARRRRSRFDRETDSGLDPETDSGLATRD
jgi:probable blue pigment (indigoidine) exporter